MPISNPAEQLIHDLVQERAKQYWEAASRLKAQQSSRKKVGEALQKRQSDLLSSAGIKPNQLQQFLKEDASNLKAYLDKTRPPLISRASLSVQDAKFGSQLTARLGGLGIAIPPNAGFELPPDPSEVLPIDPSKIKIKGVSRGVADWPFAQGGRDVPPVDVVFYFIPSENAHYSITAYFAVHGFYILYSDDSWWNSRHAAVSLDISLDVYQFGDRGWKSFPKPIDRFEQNTNEFDNYDQNLSFNEVQDFRQGEPVVVTARIKVNADAYGDGSYAEINFADGDANYIQPQYLWVTH